MAAHAKRRADPYGERSEAPAAGPGEVAEWSIAPHSKCGEPQGSGGSNPSLSAMHYHTKSLIFRYYCSHKKAGP